MVTRRRDKVFSWWARVVSRRPVAVLAVAWLLAAGAIGVAASQWKFQSDRNLLISDKLEWNRRFIEAQKHFPGAHDQYVVVDAGPEAAKAGSAAQKKARAAVEELGARLSMDAHVAEAVWGAEFSPRVLRLAAMPVFKENLAKIAQSAPMLESPTPGALLGAISRQMIASRDQQDMSEAEAVRSIAELQRLIAAMGAVIEHAPGAETQAASTPTTQPIDFGALVNPPSEDESTWHYLTSENGRLHFIRVTPRLDKEQLDALFPALAAIRGAIDAVAVRHPGIEIGVTGIEVMEADETAAATWDSTWTSLLAAVVVTFVLITAYHTWRSPLFTVIALGTAIAWTYGFLFIAVGHLQVLSVVFNIMLLGLGIGYGIYLSSAYELQRHKFPDTVEGFEQTLDLVLRTMGPGVFTGAITTAGAFVTTVFTDFTGVAEMGYIASVGVMLCFLGLMTVFPALLRLFKWRHAHVASMESRWFHYFEERWVMPFVRHPRLTLTIAGLLTAASLLAIFQMRFDYDLVKLQPRNAPSVQWQERIVRDGKQSIWFGLSVCDDMAQARQRAEAFLKLPTVGGVGGVGLLFPADEAEKVALIQKTRAELGEALTDAIAELPATSIATTTTPRSVATTAPASASTAAPAGPDLFAQLAFFRNLMRLSTLRGDIPPAVKAELDRLGRTIDRVSGLGAKMTAGERRARIEHLTDQYRQWRQQSVQQIALALDPAPLTPADLPHELMRSYIDDRGRLALEVYPSLTKDPGVARLELTSPLDPLFLGRFIRECQSIDDQITGVIVQIFHSGHLIKSAYQVAGIIALVMVAAMVYADFRNVRDAMLILLPVAMAFAITFGLMWCLDMTVNMANIIVLPLMFGIGVDSGVHVLNRFRQHPDDQPYGLTHGTGKGITITCLTSVICFAAMMLSSHRGISSLGFVLATGLAMTMLACWTVMPAWLTLRRRAMP